MEILPEELNNNATQELNNARTQLNQIVAKDIDSIRSLLAKNNIKMQLEEFEDPSYTIRKAFTFRNEQLIRNPEVIKSFIGQWTMSKEVLLHLANKIIEILPFVKKQYNDYNSLSLQQREKRIVFIQLTRTYQILIGYAVNIMDVIADYDEVFTFLCRRIADRNYSFEEHRERKISRISHIELFEAVEDLLLRGNYSRDVPTPLIRSVLEVMILRTILDPKYSTKYKVNEEGEELQVLQDIRLAEILNAAQNLNYKFTIEIDAIKRLYEWGNISTHRAWRMRHSQMWYALVVVKQLSTGILAVKEEETSKALSKILEEMIKERKKRNRVDCGKKNKA